MLFQHVGNIWNGQSLTEQERVDFQERMGRVLPASLKLAKTVKKMVTETEDPSFLLAQGIFCVALSGEIYVNELEEGYSQTAQRGWRVFRGASSLAVCIAEKVAKKEKCSAFDYCDILDKAVQMVEENTDIITEKTPIKRETIAKSVQVWDRIYAISCALRSVQTPKKIDPFHLSKLGNIATIVTATGDLWVNVLSIEAYSQETKQAWRDALNLSSFVTSTGKLDFSRVN